MDEFKARVCVLTREESFSLRSYRLHDPAGPDGHADAGSATPIDVAMVDGWLQIDVPVTRVPTPPEARDYFEHLGQVVGEAREAGLLRRWTFVHKHPGLRLRFAATPGSDAGQLIARLHAAFPARAWTGVAEFAAYFEQRELLCGLGEDATEILCRSADVRIASARAGTTADVPTWAGFTVAFLYRYLPDTWWVWEALARFMRLRGGDGGASEHGPALGDPRPLLAVLPSTTAAGFEASVALLTCLNYLYNQWGLDLGAQRRVLRLASDLTRPELATP